MDGSVFRRRGSLPTLVATVAVACAVAASAASAAAPPYTIPVALPAASTSPAIDPAAPYTPVVLSLIAQLEAPPLDLAKIQNASRLLHDTPANTANGWPARPTAFNANNVSCHNVGPVLAPTGTTPSIQPICWTDAQGVLNTSGPQARGSTAPMTLMGLAASFDRSLGNAWGQTEGTEARSFMVTGLFGPQTDLDRLPNWGRNLTTTGEDPYLSQEFIAAQIHGIQGVGAMSEMKHFAVYNGQNQNANTDIQDQPFHEAYLTPYEGGFVDGRAAATMCSYQIFRDTSTSLPSSTSTVGYPAGVSSLAGGSLSPFKGTSNPQTWPLNESHFSCEQPLLLTYTLHDLWNSVAFVGSDYPATHSTSGIFQGEDQEMPTANGFFAGGAGGTDPTGSTCAAAGSVVWDPPCAPGSTRVGGIPDNFQSSGKIGCPDGGCTLNQGVLLGVVPLSVYNQSLARVLYQEERFGMLGCEEPTPLPSCANPGGIGGDRTGTAPLPDGPTSGAPVLGTRNGDAAIVERYAEEGATLLKNDGHALPLTSSDLAGGVLVTGGNANHTVADPTNEASLGLRDRNAVNPLEQLRFLSGDPDAFTFVPANDPTGQPVPASVLATDNSGGTLGGLALSVDGGRAAKDPNPIDHTAVNGNQLAPGHTYTWSGYVYVPAADTYTFSFQQSPTLPTGLNCPQTGQFGSTPTDPVQTLCAAVAAGAFTTPADAVTFTFDGVQRSLNAIAPNVYGASVPGSPTNAGYTDALMVNRVCQTTGTAVEAGTSLCDDAVTAPSPGYHSISITVNNATSCVSTPAANAAGVNPAVPAVIAPCVPASFRFAYSRAAGDIADAAAAAAGKAKAIVFVNTGTGTSTTIPNPYGEGPATISAVEAMSQSQVDLIKAVSAANPNTSVVINSDNPVDVSTWNTANVKGILSMWFAGQEGGTATARLLLGLASPSGHTALTWPASRTDTIWAYPETLKLYPGEPDGPLVGHPNVHLERLNYNYGTGPFPPCVNTALAGANGTTCTNETEGIFEGYRFFDRQGITPAFPFGFGLSYTTFGFSNLKLTPTPGAVDVSFDLKNTGPVAGADAVQVYVGPGPDVAGVQQAVRALRGFERVDLGPGESRRVTIQLDARSFQYWDEKSQSWVTDWGDRTILVGDADAPANLPLSGTEAPLKGASEEAADLLAMVQGVGPGNSLNAKAKTIQSALAAGRNAAACGAITGLKNEVRAQTGKKIPADRAAAIQREADRVWAAAGC